jgi:vacuolar protein sorting-associated protein 13A/C
VFDFGSKTAEGVRATAVYFDDKANEKRERDIRVMYAQE